MPDRQVCSSQGCYGLSDGAFAKVKQAVADTKAKNIEHGAAFCKKGGELIAEDECTGTSCSVRKASCHFASGNRGVAGFHTHPYVETGQKVAQRYPEAGADERERIIKDYLGFKPTEPSFADLLGQVNDSAYGRSEGVECIASPWARNMTCHALKRTLGPDERRQLNDAYAKEQHTLGRRAWDKVLGAGTYARDWGILSEVDVTQDSRPPTRGLTAKDYRTKLAWVKRNEADIRSAQSDRKIEKAPYEERVKERTADLRTEMARIRQRVRGVRKEVYGQASPTELATIRRLTDDIAALRKRRAFTLKELYDSVPTVAARERRAVRVRLRRRRKVVAREVGAVRFDGMLVRLTIH